LYIRRQVFTMRRKKDRVLRALQIEVTSRCTRSCSVCPRSQLSERWIDGDLTEGLWKLLEPGLDLAEHVHLQGWGEPLLHPKLPTWAARAREAGCTIGITTNGDLLPDALSWLVEGAVDLITISTAGYKGSHSRLRDNSEFIRVIYYAHELIVKLREHGVKAKVKLSYLLTRSNAHELPMAVRAASDAGIDELYVIHLDCRTSAFQFAESAFSGRSLTPGVDAYLKEAEKSARRNRIRFRGPAANGEKVLACALNPMHFAFITWRGLVGPCTYLLLPIEGAIPRWDESGMRHVDPVAWGDLNQEPLSRIMGSDLRTRFVEPFGRRLAAEDRFLKALDLEQSVRALRAIDDAVKERRRALEENPFPGSCTGCPKSLGW